MKQPNQQNTQIQITLDACVVQSNFLAHQLDICRRILRQLTSSESTTIYVSFTPHILQLTLPNSLVASPHTTVILTLLSPPIISNEIIA
ncbi:hypothetical protein BLNAU_972 [Blattamonas nauphoetae]|uniref:Uncharacterized protein n=1 Tax=Blattamonas nauphoetae TaxID=2049346 RepID=A0ABQ9YJF7_9EUKA|nr:hypothetical protein BLNAU_972 [Blattamonas nauphoetae]